MYQAIQTKFLAPTNHHPARVKAFCESGSMVLDWDHSRGVVDNHTIAARRLSVELGWGIALQGGFLPGRNAGCVFVRAD